MIVVFRDCEYQFDEKYQNSLFLELWERELKSFTRD